jgi:hypothetical protein
MVSVVLRDGRVIQYNEATTYSTGDTWVDIKDNHSGYYATFPTEVVERVEFDKPCQILSESREKKRMKKYK